MMKKKMKIKKNKVEKKETKELKEEEPKKKIKKKIKIKKKVKKNISSEELQRKKKRLEKISQKKAIKAVKAAKRKGIEERVEKLKTILRDKINKFSCDHKVYLPCYPEGIKKKNQTIASTSFWQHIYICKTICEKQCEEYNQKIFLCRDIGCPKYPICMSKPVAKRVEFCKSKNLHKDRVELYALYKKFFHLMAVYRGLKIDEEQTLKYLDKIKQKKQKKKQEKEIPNGKVSSGEVRRKGSSSKKAKTNKNDGSSSTKAPSKSGTKKRKRIKS